MATQLHPPCSPEAGHISPSLGRTDLHLHEDGTGCCFFCELSTAEEEYLIRCNGIRVIRFQKDDICNLLQLL